MRLVFDIQESRKFERYCQSKATVDVLGMCLYASFTDIHTITSVYLSCLGITIFISAWAISVARSTISGNARAFGCGTGNRTVPTSFFYAVSHMVECVQLGNTG